MAERTGAPRLRVLMLEAPGGSRDTVLESALARHVDVVGVVRPRPGRLFELVDGVRHLHPRRTTRYTRRAFGSARFRRCSALCADEVRAIEHDVMLQLYPVLYAPPAERPYVVYTDNTMAVTQRHYPSWAPLRPTELERELRSEAGVLRAAAAVAAASTQARRSMIEDYGLLADRVHVVDGPVLIPIPEACPARADSLADVVLFAGTSFYGHKGGEMLVRAWERVARQRPAARLVVAGPSPRPTGLPDSCSWLGPLDRDELVEAYLSARVLAVPSRFEAALPNVVREAMALGLPVVATDIAGIRDAFPDSAWLVGVDDDAGLADRVLSLLADRDLAARTARAGHRHAQTELAPAVVAERIVRLLESAAGRAEARPEEQDVET